MLAGMTAAHPLPMPRAILPDDLDEDVRSVVSGFSPEGQAAFLDARRRAEALDLEVLPMDDAFLATLPEEARDALQSAEARFANGTLRTIPHAEILKHIEAQRIEAMKGG
jgi:hypothetical protein